MKTCKIKYNTKYIVSCSASITRVSLKLYFCGGLGEMLSMDFSLASKPVCVSNKNTKSTRRLMGM